MASDADRDGAAACTGSGSGRVLTTGASGSCRLQTADCFGATGKAGPAETRLGRQLDFWIMIRHGVISDKHQWQCMHVQHITADTMAFVAGVTCFAIGCAGFATLNVGARCFAMASHGSEDGLLWRHMRPNEGAQGLSWGPDKVIIARSLTILYSKKVLTSLPRRIYISSAVRGNLDCSRCFFCHIRRNVRSSPGQLTKEIACKGFGSGGTEAKPLILHMQPGCEG